MNKSNSFTIAKINFRYSKLSYSITACAVLLAGLSTISYRFFVNDAYTISLGNYLYLLLICTPIFIPLLNFRKIMNINGEKSSFLKASLFNYFVFAAGVSLVNTIIYYKLDYYQINTLHIKTVNLIEVFGWTEHGMVLAFFQQFFFLFTFALFTHTLAFIQTFWLGLVVDVLIIAIICIFTPIAPLRASLAWFFNMIIFHQNAYVQMGSCLFLGALLYLANLSLQNRKRT